MHAMPTQADHPTDNLHLELIRQLETRGADEPGDPWRVERVLKRSPSEVTQLVWLRMSGGGELGPYIRKLIAEDSGLGQVWLLLWRRQRQGLRSCQLPRLLACAEREGTLSVVMEQVQGPTLRERILETPPESRLIAASTLMPGLCSAVTELNGSLGEVVVHRDITPSNVICSGLAGEVPVLVDLGIARTWNERQDADTTHFGTRAYAPPEQFGFGQTDLRTDVYALGMCAFFCLTGRDPTPGDREAGFADRSIPEAWRDVIVRACSFDPDDRFQSAQALEEALAIVIGPGENGDGSATSPQEAKAAMAKPERHAAPKGVLLRVWRARNVVVLPLVALLVAASTANAFDPVTLNRGNTWINAYGYLVFMNYGILALGYVLMDKRWLRAHVRVIREVPARRIYGTLALVFVALTTLLFVLSILMH